MGYTVRQDLALLVKFDSTGGFEVLSSQILLEFPIPKILELPNSFGCYTSNTTLLVNFDSTGGFKIQIPREERALAPALQAQPPVFLVLKYPRHN